MAKAFPLVLIALCAMVGCQQTATTSLPAANFSPPLTGGAAQIASNKNNVQQPRQALPQFAGIPRDWTPPSGTPIRPWKWIVIHHSDTPAGGAQAFNRAHIAKGWDELGYDFVIGNGTDTADGQVEVGSRWTKQKQGAHAKTADNRFNEYGIGICLVGNFDLDRPTPAQMRSLAKLVAYLERTYRIGNDFVIGHRDTKPTDCPGRNLSVAVVRREAQAVLASMGGADSHASANDGLSIPAPSVPAAAFEPGQELLHANAAH